MTESEFEIKRKEIDHGMYLDEYQEYEKRLDNWVYDAMRDAEVSDD